MYMLHKKGIRVNINNNAEHGVRLVDSFLIKGEGVSLGIIKLTNLFSVLNLLWCYVAESLDFVVWVASSK